MSPGLFPQLWHVQQSNRNKEVLSREILNSWISTGFFSFDFLDRACPAHVFTHSVLTNEERPVMCVPPGAYSWGCCCWCVSQGNKSEAGKVRHLLTDASDMGGESTLLVMSACDLRWTCVALPSSLVRKTPNTRNTQIWRIKPTTATIRAVARDQRERRRGFLMRLGTYK